MMSHLMWVLFVVCAVILIKKIELCDAQNVCDTQQCSLAAKLLLNYVDVNVDPCVDFYQFACGKFRNDTKLNQRNSVDIFTIINDKLDEQLLNVINKPCEPTELRPFRLLKALFSKCTDYQTLESGLKEAVKRKLLSIGGGWPILKEDDWTPIDWYTLSKIIRANGYINDYLIKLTINKDKEDPTKNVIYLDQPRLGFGRSSLVQGIYNKNVINYYKKMVNVSVAFGADETRAWNELFKTVEFVCNLANITLSIFQHPVSERVHIRKTIQELQEMYPRIDWLEYINAILEKPTRVPVVTLEDIVVLASPDYLAKLFPLLQETPDRVVANFLMWRMLDETTEILYPAVWTSNNLINFFITGKLGNTVRLGECLNLSKKSMLVAYNAVYSRNYLHTETKTAIENIVGQIRVQYRGILEEVEWMDETTRKEATNKLANMKLNLVYPDELFDDLKILTFYENLEDFYSNDLLDSLLKIRKHQIAIRTKKFKEPLENNWAETTETVEVNARYNPFENTLIIPGAFLQHSIYSAEHPAFMNYGGIGFVIGHEITHGFDKFGRNFDRNGDLKDWWTKATVDVFNLKSDCLDKQYSNYTVKELNKTINGEYTLNENVADNGGSRMAYYAYDAWCKINGDEPALISLPYNNKQLFWISFAINLCSVESLKYINAIVEYGKHSPHEFRVNGALRNSPDFVQDYNCASDTPMNPKKKCKLW